jgi:glycosyltransferase involved in cell wall biosynthesis
MRILAIADVFFPDAPGGLGRVAWDVAKAMANRGHEVGLLAGDRSAGSRRGGLREEMIQGVRVYRYPRPHMSGLDPFRASKQIYDAATALQLTLKRKQYDVVHCHSIYTGQAALAGAPAKPVLHTVHSPAIQELAYNWKHGGLVGRLTSYAGAYTVRQLERNAMAAAVMRHALSQFTVEQMGIEYGSALNDYAVIPHWADHSWFRSVSKAEARGRLGWPANEPIFFTVRQLRRRYGIDTAVEALAPLVRAHRCRFYIGGDGEERRSLAALVSRLNAGDRIQLLGRISDEDLRLAYQAADVFVLPTRALECFGLIILEALACGVPVLGTRVGAIPENLEPILPEWLVPPDDASALCSKAEAYLCGSLKAPSAAELIAYVRERFGEERVVGMYEALLAETLGR